MNKIFLIIFILIYTTNAGQIYKKNAALITYDDIPDEYFLTYRFNIIKVISENLSQLNLSPEQLSQIKELNERYYPLMFEKAKKIKEEEERLKEVVLKENNPDVVKQLLIDIAQLKTQLSLYDINLLKAVQSILTKKQFEKIINYVDKTEI
ncbi:hypothetical protein JCM14244_08980 [Venenivibrio stagnispumantis]|uniref:Periplasmic heavy metal sensor n=1 Tax=Venenivibrio stagnispumantis TaxID=407998 RepID=A0AA45WLT0_9AQUI|nr:hypothetical protein [Venenivibrio stagnispumantis]MCW4573405.1 hypothetical protein [Venenivibrio stagnispumantis]SMP12288.1 hypothetical protein SAMN06264868_10952 [Venenivibrio stagnispumantis]